MAFLKFKDLALWVCGLIPGFAGGCSFVLDPDELVAERSEVPEDTAGDGAPSDGEDLDSDVDGDGRDTRDGEDAEDTTDTGEPVDSFDALDTLEADDGETDDDTGPADTDEPDILADGEVLDTSLAEVAEVDSSEVNEDTAMNPDTAPEVELIVRTSGGGDCTLDYYLQNLTNCPKTCGWTLVFDARTSRGLSSFSWRFAVSDGYIVTPESSVGPIASVVISTPACLFFPAASMRPATVSATVSADGGAWVEAATIPFSVRQVTMCGASLCEAP